MGKPSSMYDKKTLEKQSWKDLTEKLSTLKLTHQKLCNYTKNRRIFVVNCIRNKYYKLKAKQTNR